MTFAAPFRRVDTAKGHHYKDANNRRVPGVTTLIGKGVPKDALVQWAANATADYAVDHWAELDAMPPAKRVNTLRRARYESKDEAARRGTEVHTAAELLLAGKPATVADEIRGHVESYVRFLDEFEVQPVLVEFSAFSYRWGYAGTADLCARITLPDRGPALVLADLKTTRSGVYGETALQLAGYKYADVWVVDGEERPPLEVEFCVAIHVRGDGYDLVPVEVGDVEFRTFLYAMRVGQWNEESRDLVGAPILPATTSRYRLLREDTTR